MDILVTGGTGFTGAHLTRRLVDKGHNVTVIDNQDGLRLQELKDAGVTTYIGSINDYDLLERAVANQDVIFHLAAAFRDISLPDSEYWRTNVAATRKLLELAKDNGASKVVYCSTQGVHGNIDNPPGLEQSPIEPEDYYQRTKYEGEVVCQEFIEDNMDITILRPTAIYGPGDPGRFLMLFKLVNKGFFPFFGDGRTTYHPLYIDNFIDAFMLAMTKPIAKGQTYIIGDEHYYPIVDLVQEVIKVMDKDKVFTPHFPFWTLYWPSYATEVVFKAFNKTPPLFRRRADWYRQVRAFNIDKAHNHLGYQPKVDIHEGLSRTYKWYKENGFITS